MNALSIAELIDVAHPRIHVYKATALLAAYFDETGTHGESELVLIAGLLTQGDIWKGFEAAWLAQLKVFEVPYFHGAECEDGRGIFAALDRPLRNLLSEGLAKVIANHRPIPVMSSIFRADWDRFKNGPIGQRYGDPYNLCFENCVRQAVTWCHLHSPNETVALIFERQTNFSVTADKLFQAYKSNVIWGRQLTSLTFADPLDYPPLQAADLLAYEQTKALQAARKGASFLSRPAMKVLLKQKVPAMHGHCTVAILEEMIAKNFENVMPDIIV